MTSHDAPALAGAGAPYPLLVQHLHLEPMPARRIHVHRARDVDLDRPSERAPRARAADLHDGRLRAERRQRPRLGLRVRAVAGGGVDGRGDRLAVREPKPDAYDDE